MPEIFKSYYIETFFILTLKIGLTDLARLIQALHIDLQSVDENAPGKVRDQSCEEHNKATSDLLIVRRYILGSICCGQILSMEEINPPFKSL